MGLGTPALAGRYVLTDRVGVGGMGSVWRARDLRTRAWVAVKVLGRHDSDLVLRFAREQSVRVGHPHVLAPTGWVAEDDRVAFTMDLVRGGSVQDLLDRHGPLPEDWVAVVLDQTLQALEAVHAAGIVHRDVKPANLLLEPTGTGRPHVRLGDFGVAAVLHDVRLTLRPGPVGTDGYLSPEQQAGAPPSPAQDLYAVGVLGVQLLTGLPPRQHALPPPGRLRPLLDGLTRADPRSRPRSATDALLALRRIGVPDGSPWEREARPPDVTDQLRDPPYAAARVALAAAGLCFAASIVLSLTALWTVLGR